MREYKIFANMVENTTDKSKSLVQYDTGNIIEFELYNNLFSEKNKKINLTNEDILAFWLLPGETIPIQTNVKINSNGNAIVKTNKQITNKTGNVKLQLLIKNDTEEARTQIIYFDVSESIDGNKAVESDPRYYSDLVTDLIEIRDNVKNETQGKINELSKNVSELKNNARDFKPKFGTTLYLGEAQDLNGTHYCQSLERCKKIAEPLLPYLEEFPLTFHISYNENTNEFYIVENPDTMHNFVEWLESKGKVTPAIKMYQQRYKMSHIQAYGIKKYHDKWKEFETLLGNKFKDLNVEYFSIHNEVSSIVGSTEHEQYVLEEIQLAKDMGYKAAYDYAGWSDYGKVLKSVKDVLDAHFINMYPEVSMLREDFDFEYACEQFGENLGFNLIKVIKQDYPNSDIIINECGIQDNWYSLAAPAKWDWKNVKSSSGVVPSSYLKMLFENFKDKDVKSVWWWYDSTLNNNLSKAVMKKYLKGE